MDDNLNGTNRKPLRLSKLKRRKRKAPPANFSNPLTQFAANTTRNSTYFSSSRENVSSSSDKVSSFGPDEEERSQQADGDRQQRNETLNSKELDRIIPRSAADILQLNDDYDLFAQNAISAEIDYFITAKIDLQQSLGSRNSSTSPDRKRKMREIKHSVLGSIAFNLSYPFQNGGDLYSFEDVQNETYCFCKLVFPPCGLDANDHVKETNCKDDFNRGDGIITSSDNIAFPGKNPSKVKESDIHTRTQKMVKIISQHGATIRGHHDIDSVKGEEYIGKLPFGSVRVCTESKWLQPPSNACDDSEEEARLVAVKRLKIRLLPCDIRANDPRDDESPIESISKEGWISDRSRLFDDAYVIATCI